VAFINEIIVSKNYYFKRKDTLPQQDDRIFFYSSGELKVFNKLYQPYSREKNGTYLRWLKEKGQEAADKRMERGSEVGNIWTINVGEDKPVIYPTQKIARLLERIISLSTKA
jgi:hypothetical protein